MKARMLSVIVAVIVLVILSYPVLAQPEGPGQIIRGSNERRGQSGTDNATGGTIVQAQAGNVTALTINSTKITSRWQGYYGNVTGEITLDDAFNSTLYNWQLASPQGEIYASNGSATGAVTWANVFCFNYSNNRSEGQPIVQRFNGTDLEQMIGANVSNGDRDSVNGTFNATFTGSFAVGSTTIDNTDSCRQVTLFVNDVHQTTDFVEVLLTDNNSIIFTALLEQDADGFQTGAATLDFELIVGENGDITTATNYYFFVELT